MSEAQKLESTAQRLTYTVNSMKLVAQRSVCEDGIHSSEE
jgi:hypothetical protein